MGKSRCWAPVTTKDGWQRQCRKVPPAGTHYCEEHHQLYVKKTDTYKKATLEMEALDEAFVRLGDTYVEGLGQEDLVHVAEISRAYLDCLERAVRGREEHHRRFFTQVDSAHLEYLEVLKYRLENAFAFLYRIESREMELSDKGLGW
ncbi:hypothetical protein L226DRAFT_616776 [Lentinus tigrinus ALCF2SS1-7]|uniref:Uncharacterized protein n=1 Tax=Lentinus tigrinus ALCF2SS1-6 TaxID=1328759 RepID=A0A5C2SAW2_9APHY|nr:hypothetical protein L227DRAFT_653378 [Lentinus tigrinus ALCF2SS1-6]RPD69534.1 hypothetical protein L226DRAFT_616776 [Lentinus tigrinus ALCF2SS1-7]